MNALPHQVELAIERAPSALIVERSASGLRFYPVHRHVFYSLLQNYPRAFVDAVRSYLEHGPRYDSIELLGAALGATVVANLIAEAEGQRPFAAPAWRIAAALAALLRGEQPGSATSPTVFFDPSSVALVREPPKLKLGELDRSLRQALQLLASEIPWVLVDRNGNLIGPSGATQMFVPGLRTGVESAIFAQGSAWIERVARLFDRASGSRATTPPERHSLDRTFAPGAVIASSRGAFTDVFLRRTTQGNFVFGVRIPAHIVELPGNRFVPWPEAELSSVLAPDAETGPGPMLSSLRFSSSAYDHHPLNGNDHVCLGESALHTVMECQQRSATIAEQLAHGLLTAQHVVLYGVLPGVTVYHAYQMPADEEPRATMSKADAQRAAARGTEIIRFGGISAESL